jgi:hypothetical protein
MKKLLQMVIMLCLPMLASGQTYSAIGILNEHYKLNSGSRSMMGGVSRVAIPVTIPAYSRHLYLTISTSESDQVQSIINGCSAATQLTMAVRGASPAQIAQLGGQIQGTVRTGSISVYVLPNAQNAQTFLNKQDDGSWQPYNGNYRENFSGGTIGVELPEMSEPVTIYICFRNPSGYKAQYMSIEATAMVKGVETPPVDYIRR